MEGATAAQKLLRGGNGRAKSIGAREQRTAQKMIKEGKRITQKLLWGWGNGPLRKYLWGGRADSAKINVGRGQRTAQKVLGIGGRATDLTKTDWGERDRPRKKY